jgi:hypothetical protein
LQTMAKTPCPKRKRRKKNSGMRSGLATVKGTRTKTMKREVSESLSGYKTNEPKKMQEKGILARNGHDWSTRFLGSDPGRRSLCQDKTIQQVLMEKER